jgi:hypothetical protein
VFSLVMGSLTSQRQYKIEYVNFVLRVFLYRLYEGRYLTECGNAALDVPFQSIKTCVRMKQAVSLAFTWY